METDYMKRVKSTVRRLTTGRMGLNKYAAELAVDHNGKSGAMSAATFRPAYLVWLGIDNAYEGVMKNQTASPSKAAIASMKAKMRRHANILGFRGPKSTKAIDAAMQSFITAWEDTYVNEFG